MAATDASTPRLSIRGLKKTFLYTQALRGVDLDVWPGEVVALVGENGAGKSTLARIVAGVHTPDEGTIAIEGQQVRIQNVLDARALGIAIVHQELNLVPHLTVADNIFLGREPTGAGPLRWLQRRRLYQDARRMLAAVGLDVSPDERVADLPLAQRQMVEIARALSEQARLLILDEPTSALAESDAAELLRIVGDLKRTGISVLYISHRLEEVLSVADRIVVLRDGEKVGELPADQADKRQILSLMVGRDFDMLFPKQPVELGPVVLEVADLTAPGVIEPVSFSVRAGEIFGVAGLVGSGRSELLMAVFGANPVRTGHVTVDGRRFVPRRPWQAMALGVGMVPEDRKLQGLILNMSVQDNIVLAVLRALAAWIVRRPRREAATAARLVAEVGVRTASLDQPVRYLSGGNQQKALLAKWLAPRPQVLLLDEPTRGIDVGAKYEIYRLICQLAAQGVAVVMVSSEMEEIIGLCDRVLVMNSGRPAGTLERSELSEAAIMELAAT